MLMLCEALLVITKKSLLLMEALFQNLDYKEN